MGIEGILISNYSSNSHLIERLLWVVKDPDEVMRSDLGSVAQVSLLSVFQLFWTNFGNHLRLYFLIFCQFLMGASWKGAWDRLGKWSRLGTRGMADRSDISGNSAKTAICSFWERLASAKSCVWSQLARICRQGREDRLDMLGRLGTTQWVG